MERTFDAIVDRTRSRLDVPTLRTLFAAKHRPHTRGEVSPRLSAVIERPRYGLTLFKVHFGLLTLKAYTKGEHVLRFEAIVHNARTLRTSRALERFPDVVTRLTSMVDRFCSAVDCVDVGFLPDGTLDELPLPSQVGAVRVGGIDLNKPPNAPCHGGRPRSLGCTERLHGRRPGHEGAIADGPNRRRLHGAPSRL